MVEATAPVYFKFPKLILRTSTPLNPECKFSEQYESSTQEKTELFGSCTPVLVPEIQWSGCPNSVILLLFGLGVPKSRASQGLSTAVLYSGWKLPPHPQITCAVVGNLKYRSGSVGSWDLSEIPPIDPVRPIQKETQKETQKQHLAEQNSRTGSKKKPNRCEIFCLLEPNSRSLLEASWNQTAEE